MLSIRKGLIRFLIGSFMVKNIIKIVKGNQFTLDSDLSHFDVILLALRYFIMLLRGLIFLRRKVFLGCAVKISKKNNLQLGRWVKISDFVNIDALAKSPVLIGDNCSIGDYSRIECTGSVQKVGLGFRMGAGSGIGAFSFVGAAGGVEIGENVIMGQYVSFHSENHVFDKLDIPIKHQGVTNKGIKVGQDCWVGSKVTFLDGTIIGCGSVVAAGAVVSGVFPDNVIIGGVPARIIKYRR